MLYRLEQIDKYVTVEKSRWHAHSCMYTLTWEDSNRKGKEEGEGWRNDLKRGGTGATEERKRKKVRKEESVSERERAKLGTMNIERERWEREKKREVSKKKEKISEPRWAIHSNGGTSQLPIGLLTWGPPPPHSSSSLSSSLSPSLPSSPPPPPSLSVSFFFFFNVLSVLFTPLDPCLSW